MKVLGNTSYLTHQPLNTLCYCDPPYFRTKFDKRRENLLSFDTNVFWETMREWSKDDIVVVSETEAPDDFVEIFSLDRFNTFNKKTIVEKPFVKKKSLR